MRKLKKKVVSGNFTHFACVESFVYNKLWHSIKSTSYTRVEELKPRKRYRRCNKFLHCRARELSKKKNFFIALMMNEKKERSDTTTMKNFNSGTEKYFVAEELCEREKFARVSEMEDFFHFPRIFNNIFINLLKTFLPTHSHILHSKVALILPTRDDS